MHGGEAYLEEGISFLGESVGLSVVHEDGTFVDDRHLGKRSLRVHQGVHQSKHHDSAEETNHSVVLVHV